MRLVIGIDLGGTNIKAALIECGGGGVVASVSRLTLDGEYVDGVPRFALTVQEMVVELEERAGQGKLRAGLSAPGLARRDGRCIQWMPGRMDGLEGLDWADFLGREVRVLNDAHAALLGEVWTGAGRGCEDVMMLTLGTGVGGAVFSGGRLLRGCLGRAGHLGHISVDGKAARDDFNTPGSLEDMIGNQSLWRRCGGRYANTHALVAAAAAGDSVAAGLWLESVRHLAVGMVSLINVLDPELVILGGGIAAGAGEQLLGPLRGWLDELEWRPGGHQVRLALAAAGEWAGALGSAWEVRGES